MSNRTFEHADRSAWRVRVSDVASTLGRSEHLERTFPAPTGIGDDFYGVKPGSQVHLVGDLDCLKGGLVLTATVSAVASGRCSRCLTPLRNRVSARVSAWMPFEAPAEDEESGGLRDVDVTKDEEEDAYPLVDHGNFADFESIIRDALFSRVPATPLCKPDCRGLCPLDGVNLNEHPDHHHERPLDPRWAALSGLKARLEKRQSGR